MSLLDKTYFGNTLLDWAIAAGVVLVSILVLEIIKRVAGRRLAAFAKQTVTQLDDLVADLLSKVRFFFILVVSVYFGSFAITLPATANNVIQIGAILALLLQTAIWGNTIIGFWIARTTKQRLQEDAASATTFAALGFIGKLILWTVVFLLALDNLGINITALIAGLGVGGIAVALALQNILGDLFASLSIVLDKPFVIGDFIIVDQYLGTVEHIGLKTTRVRSLSGEQVIFSNGDLLKSRVRNFKRMFERRVLFSIGVTYQTPHDKLAEIPAMIRRIIEEQDKTRFDRCHFKEYGDSALLFETVYYVKNPDFNVYMDIHQKINLAIYKQFEEQNIQFAYPTRTLFINQEPSSPTR
ncbi:MAG: mechanosensitive ion channel family protein [Bacteroidota bacterium]